VTTLGKTKKKNSPPKKKKKKKTKNADRGVGGFPAFIVNRSWRVKKTSDFTLYEGVGNGRGDRRDDEARRESPDGALELADLSASIPAYPY